MSARVVGAELAKSIVKAWLESEPARSGPKVERVKGVRRARRRIERQAREAFDRLDKVGSVRVPIQGG